MREIAARLITQTVKTLCIRANTQLPCDVEASLRSAHEKEDWPTARGILDLVLENVELARAEHTPLCQDTGLACVFLKLGQDAHVTGGDLYEAVHEGVRQGYREGYLRASSVEDPLQRINTGDNTPAVIHCDIVPGDGLCVMVAPKGFGSENMSRLGMLKPSDGVRGVCTFVLETVRLAGPNPCPPVVVGVGIGSTFDGVALLAKRALLRDLRTPNPNPYYASLEERLLEEINALGIGPQGFGGRTTALQVHVETAPTHIAGLPVAVNIGCHVTRRVQEQL